jgi:hypothetical protein
MTVPFPGKQATSCRTATRSVPWILRLRVGLPSNLQLDDSLEVQTAGEIGVSGNDFAYNLARSAGPRFLCHRQTAGQRKQDGSDNNNALHHSTSSQPTRGRRGAESSESNRPLVAEGGFDRGKASKTLWIAEDAVASRPRSGEANHFASLPGRPESTDNVPGSDLIGAKESAHLPAEGGPLKHNDD